MRDQADKKAERLIRLVERIKELVASRFFGELTIKIEDGMVVYISKRESIKP
jgi:hypothetical protein